MNRLLKGTALVTGTGLALYEIDTHFYARTFQRNLRTILTGIKIIADYKLNFTPEKADKISNLHTRVAEDLYRVCTTNAGLYIKFGQQIASMEHMAPPQYNQRFRTLYDNAPAVTWDEVVDVIKKDLGKHPDELFDNFEQEPIASASIAQVHRARRKDTGELVAVKVQKPYIRPQLNWDIRTYRLFLRVVETLFDLPLSWSADYVEKHMREEVDFRIEARNSERCYKELLKDNFLKKRVYVPKVYWETTSERVMTSEFIDAVRFSDVNKVKDAGFSVKEVMGVTVDLFAHQIFQTRFVHCDPHPGNVLVRPSSNNGFFHSIKRVLTGNTAVEPEVVLLDHGLYIEESEKFRNQNCNLWKSIFVQDLDALEKIAIGWGVTDPQLLASATLQRPYNAKKAVHIKSEAFNFADVYEMQVAAKDRLKSYLANTSIIPLELIFVGRNMNLVRANNKAMGSPVNRVNMMAERAVRGLNSAALSQWNYWRFRATLFLMTIGFYLVNVRKFFAQTLFGAKGEGFEDVTDRVMRENMKKQFGMVVDETAFNA
ncbi:ABC1 family protein [Acrasis kona]|uniref:ABC1 family protein n=1 Tax=Acrasis kona TaxID=1008807 RepID=A0AAW2ZMQ9_9EUKA